MDGFGISEDTRANAVYTAGTPNLDKLRAKYPHGEISASGMDVGLPEGQMGNSEVGHLNIGAGRIVYQELTRITKDILDGDFFKNEALLWAVRGAKDNGTALHLMGLVSDGGVHSHNTHLYALLELAKREGLQNVFVHAFLDGRDVPPSSGLKFVRQLQDEMDRIGVGKIATVMGRYWSMDRDNIWERVQLAYDAIALGKGLTAESGVQAVAQSYEKGETDEFMKPTVVQTDGKPNAVLMPNDAVIFFNFRPDRARQLTRAFICDDASFDKFPRASGYIPVRFVTMTQYDATFTNLETANKPQTMENTLGEYLSSLGKTQLRIAETQKYAHVTFFFNGGVEAPNAGEERVLIDSPKIATFDLKPSMSAYEVAAEAEKRILSGEYDVMILNFANCDMVGHTGIMDAAVEAVKTVDECVGRVVEAVRKTGGRAIITADHGNSEKMYDFENDEPWTAHTTNPVPVIIVDDSRIGKQVRDGGRLCDLAPTLLKLMDVPQPAEMEGVSLIL
jgi:2,3-bisphosphoglycerate-independent phosphoglycerate mutase